MLEYTYEYNRAFMPSTPFVDVVISDMKMTDSVKTSAQLDSGADATAVPTSILRTIKAKKVGRQRMRGMSGRPEIVNIYEVRITLAREVIPVDVVGLDHLQEAVIGRDILNRFTITLDGLSLTTIIPVYD